MKRFVLLVFCVASVLIEVWCFTNSQRYQSYNYADSLENGSLFYIDDSLLNIVSPESHNRFRRSGINYGNFSHTCKLHYTPNHPEYPYYLIITSSVLYDSLSSSLVTYAEDIHAIYGYGIYLESVDNPNPEQIKSLIINYQNNLCGVIFVGDLGEAFYEIEDDFGKYGYKKWPCDLFFTDLDGEWFDSDMNGIYDTHTGNVAPEIFLARLSACGLSSLGDEVTIIKKQLQKSHNFWWKSSFLISDIALNYIDKDWENSSNFLSTNLNSIYGYNNVESIKYDSTSVFSPSDYIGRLSQNNYGFTLLAAHSTPTLHWLTNGPIYISNIKFNLSRCYLFNLFCCSACSWTTTSQSYLGGAYLFNNGATLAVIGSTKIGGMLGGRKMYSQLASKNIGESFLYWWNQHCGNNHTSNTISWNYGMTILGDPTILLRHKVSDVCVNNLILTSYPIDNMSNLVMFKASESINVSSNFIIPQGVHVIFDAPQIIFDTGFSCPTGASFETRNEGCEL